MSSSYFKLFSFWLIICIKFSVFKKVIVYYVIYLLLLYVVVAVLWKVCHHLFIIECLNLIITINLRTGFRIQCLAKLGSKALYLDKRRFSKFYRINILDNSKSLLFSFKSSDRGCLTPKVRKQKPKRRLLK